MLSPFAQVAKGDTVYAEMDGDNKVRMQRLADELVAHANDLKRHCAEMIYHYQALSQVPGEPFDAPDGVQSVASSERSASELVAIEMALAGHPREEVHAQLRQSDGLELPSEFLDSLFPQQG